MSHYCFFLLLIYLFLALHPSIHDPISECLSYLNLLLLPPLWFTYWFSCIFTLVIHPFYCHLIPPSCLLIPCYLFPFNSSFLSSPSLLPSFLFPSSCLLTAFFLSSYSLLPAFLFPSSCLLTAFFLSPHHLLSAFTFCPSCLLIPSFLSPHPLFPVSSSLPFCLLIPSSLSPHPFFLASSGVRYFPKGIFPRATAQVTISKVATSQIYIFSSDNFPKVRLGLLRRHRLPRDWALRIGLARGPSAAASTDLGSFRLGNCTFGKLSPRKLPLGCCRLRKSLWESTYYLSPSPSLCLLSPSFLSPHPLFPVSASPLSCFLITSFLFCLLIQSFLSPHPLFSVSSSPLSCLLILSLYTPSCFLITSFLSPQTHFFCFIIYYFLSTPSLIPTPCILFRSSCIIHFFLSPYPSFLNPLPLFPASTSALPISSFTSFRHCSHSLSSDPALY